jgi:hypothetical protein
MDKRRVEYREEIIDSLRDLHLDAAGKQILFVFRSSRLAPVDPEALEHTREIWTRHRRLQVKPAVAASAANGVSRSETRPGGNP